MSNGLELEWVYGNSVHGSVRYAGDVIVKEHRTSEVVHDLTDAVARALSSPLEFPSVDQAIVPGDRVVLALDPSIACRDAVTRGVVDYLMSHGVLPNQLCVVIAGHQERDAEQLKSALPAEVTVELHDADDQTKVAYVAANKQGEPIYMNRSLVDADVVIPIMAARNRDAIDYEGAYGVFPLLTDRRTRGQFYSLKQLSDPTEHQRLTSWADEAAWWVGVLVAIQVIPSEDGQVAQIMAGSPQELEQAVQASMHTLWHDEVDQTFDAVVALIDGGPTQQTWDNVARVIAATSPLISSDGTLIICTELSEKPGAALRKLRNPNRSEDAVAKQLAHDNSDDVLAANVLLETRTNNHIFLLSKLASEIVEELGMGALESLHQAEHLLHERSSCLVIHSAQHRIIRLND